MQHIPVILKNQYKLGACLREDAYGMVYAGELVSSGLGISIREYNHQYCHPSVVEHIQNDILNLGAVNHPNIVRAIDSVYTEQGKFYVIYDTPCEGTLADIIKKIGKFTERQMLVMLNDIGHAVDYLHQKRVVHGAICPENIDIMANGQIKLRNAIIDDRLNSFVLPYGRTVVPLSFLAPEQLKREPTNKTTDVFALGILAFNLLSANKPFPEITSIPMVQRNFAKGPERLTLRNPELPKYLEDIIEKAIQVKWQYRQQTVLELLGDFRNKKVTVPVDELRRREAAAVATAVTPPDVVAQDRSEVLSSPIITQPTPERSVWDFRGRHKGKKASYKKTEQLEGVSMSPKPTITMPEPSAVIKRRQMILWYVLSGVIAGALLLILHALFVNYFDAVPKVEIPHVTGLKASVAEKTLQENGLRSKIIGYVDDEKVSPDCVVSTNPEGGRVVKKNRIIKIMVSKGMNDILVPDVIERDYSQMKAIVEDKGLKLVVAKTMYSNKFQRNLIISQSPAAQTSAKRGSEIAVEVSAGYPVSMQIVERNEKQIVVKLIMRNQPDWEAQNVVVFLQDKNGRRKYAERLIGRGDSFEQQIATDPDGILDVYYFNDLAFRQELRLLDPTAEKK